MGHPGFDFARVSYHTLRNTVCPAKAYLNQILGVRRRFSDRGESGPLAAGKVFHTLMEVYYTPHKYLGTPLPGTDKHPALPSTEDVINWYMAEGVAGETIEEALNGFKRYLYQRENDDDNIKDRVLGRPEPDVHGDLRKLLSPAERKGQPKAMYAAQFDLVIRADDGKSVISVEHKLLAQVSPSTLALYQNSGQVIGQCAVWNSREDLVDKYGPMRQVLLNLTFKKSKERIVHREYLMVPITWQRDYAKVIIQTHRELASRVRRYRHAIDDHSPAAPAPEGAVAAIWPKLGMVRGECANFINSCEYLALCQEGRIEPELFQITEAGRARCVRDRAFGISAGVEIYDV